MQFEILKFHLFVRRGNFKISTLVRSRPAQNEFLKFTRKNLALRLQDKIL